MSLAGALKAVEAGKLGRTLELLLEAWRVTPAAALAELVALVGDRARRDLPPPHGRTARDRDAAWHALAAKADVVGRGVLIEYLADSTVAATLAKIEVLARGPSDPRFAAKVGDLVERPIFNANLSRTTAFWRRIFELMPQLGDPRLVVRAGTFAATWAASPDLTANERTVFPQRFARWLPALEAAYGVGPPLLAGPAAETCAAIARVIASRDDEASAIYSIARDARIDGRDTAATAILAEAAERDLLAAVYAAPDDDQPRIDYAGWLIGRRDPRGEFIRLQLAHDPRSRRTEKALLTEHKARWLGPLATMIKTPSASFVRGFLDACALKGTWDQRLVDDPGWSTVRTLELGNSGMIQLAAIATAKRALVLETLVWELREAQGPDYGHDAAVDAFHRLQLPRLRRVSVSGHRFIGRVDRAHLRNAPFAGQLDALEILIS